MKKVILALIGVLAFAGALAQADSTTEQEVKKTIIDNNQQLKKDLKVRSDVYSKDGAVEFWSSGGLMQEVAADSRPNEFESFNINVKHIKVTTLVPGQVAMAHYYSEGSMQPKGSTAVSDYRTRVSQVFVKEGGKWKLRASHWSAFAGGSGTSQAAQPE